MSLRQTIIEEKIEHLRKGTGDSRDVAFTKFAYSLVKPCEYEDLEPEDLVDGTDDKQIDVISIEETFSGADILILQAKEQNSFPTNHLTLMGNGLAWVFEQPKAEYQRLRNPPLTRKIAEIRSLRATFGGSSLHVRVFFVTKGDTKRLSSDFRQELEKIRTKFSRAGFAKFTLEPVGASELVDYLKEKESARQRVNDSLRIKYDLHVPSYINYSAAGVRGYICTVPATEIARLVTGDRENFIFDLNVRRFYGVEKGRVNPEIAATCSSDTESARFWFFNNGITIICDAAEVIPDDQAPSLKLTNVQIVNGCQTSMTLQDMYTAGKLKDDVDVLVKAFITSDPAFASRIVLTTNNQNAISSRDLWANDSAQQDYQRAFRDVYGYYYERKQNEFLSITPKEKGKLISNEKVGQAFLAVVKKRPTIARTQKYRIWQQDLYREVFPNTSVERHLLAYLIYAYCQDQKRAALKKWKDDDVRYSVVSYGVFHLARILARRFTQTEQWSDAKQTDSWINEVRNDPDVLRRHYGPSVTLLKNIVKRRAASTDNVNNVFKAGDIETAINNAVVSL
jgi:AIPR protein